MSDRSVSASRCIRNSAAISGFKDSWCGNIWDVVDSCYPLWGTCVKIFWLQKKYIYILIYFLLYLYIGWWNFPSHGVRNWGNLSFYSFPSALSDGHLMTMSCLGTTNWFGLAGCPADTSAWRTLPDGGLEVSWINQGFRRSVVSNHSMVHVMWKSFLGGANIHLEHIPTLSCMYATVLMCGFGFFFSWMIYMMSI